MFSQDESDMTQTALLRAEQITKQYPGVLALDRVDFELNRGEVRALLGKNGAGKSTLAKILSGAVHQDSGTIYIDNEPVAIDSPSDAFQVGIATVYQEMSLVPGLTVAENIMLGRWPQRKMLGWRTIDKKSTVERSLEVLETMGADLDPEEHVSRLSVAQQQIVEIAKAVSLNPKILILDEPTSALPEHEVDQLLTLVRQLAGHGMAIVYVSHRLQEVPRVADSLTVLRDGKLVGTIPIAESSPERIARMMIGGEWDQVLVEREDVRSPEVRLSVRHASRKGYLHDISFDLHAGEVLGIAGLLGSGRSELLRAIFGLDPLDSGEILVDGQPVSHPNPTSMKNRGVGLTPEDRKEEGLVLPLSVGDNLTLSSLDRISHYQVISSQQKHELAVNMVDALSIALPSTDVKAASLSGGNQQKVVIGKWLNSQVKILLMDEPTRGIDIQAKEQVYSLVRELAREGIGVIFVSSEIEEVLGVSDRILILNKGRIIDELPADQANLEYVLAQAMKEDVETP
jgi:ribose transport system ATP-binding protein